MEELIEKFSISGLSKSSSIFDPVKMKWLNGEYIKELDFEKFMEYATPFFEESQIKGKYDYRKFAKLLQSRIEIFSEIPEKVEFIVNFNKIDNEMYFNKKFKLNNLIAKDILEQAIPVFENINEWTEDNLHQATVSVAEKMEVKSGCVYTVMRIALTGVMVTPGGSVEMADILGKEESIERLNKALAWLKEE